MPLRIPLRLRSKLSIAFLLVLFPFLGLVVYDYLRDYEIVERLSLDEQLRTAQAVGAMVDATFDQGVAVGRALAVDPVVQTLDPGQVASYLDRYRSLYPQYESVNVWDAEGRLIGSSAPLPPGESRPVIADREHFRRAMATGEPALSEVILARTTGQPAVAVVVPIKDRPGAAVGAISLLLDLSMLPEHLQGMNLRREMGILVVDPTGRIGFQNIGPQLAWEQRDISWYEPVRGARDAGMFAGTPGVSLSGEPTLVAAARTHGYGWVAAVSLPTAVAMGEVRQQAMTEAGFYLGVVGIAALLALGMTYSIGRPLAVLTTTIVAVGRGELWRRAEVSTGDELETTAAAFNRTVAALEREQSRLRALAAVGAALSASLEVEEVADVLAVRAADLLGEVNWVCLLPAEPGWSYSVVKVHATEPGLRDRVRALALDQEEWVASNLAIPVVESGEPILVPDVETSSLGESLREALVAVEAVSLLGVPLRARGRTLGVLASAGFREDRRFGDEDLAAALDVAGRAGMSIDNAVLFQQGRDERLRLETVLTTVRVGVVVVDAPAGRVQMVNRAGEATLGGSLRPAMEVGRWESEVMLRQADGTPFPPGQSPIARSLLLGEVRLGEEAVMRHPSGRDVCLLVNSAPLRDSEGNLVGAVASFQDITALKDAQRRMEELARETERRRSELDAVIEGVGEGIIVVDGEGRIVRVNRQAREILRIPSAWAEGRQVREFVGMLDLRRPDGKPLRPEEHPLWRVQAGEVIAGEETLVVRPDGRWIHLLVSSGVLRDERGQVRLAMGIYRDITPIRELERAREEFISVVAHDLRSPLTVIKGFAGFLAHLEPGQHGKAAEERAVGSIATSVDRMEKMVADLLDASRIEARRLVLSRERVELGRLAREVVDRTGEVTGEHPVRVDVRGRDLWTDADPARIEQVLTNLLSNAAKYSYSGTAIEVGAEARAGEMVVWVTNQGEGIPPGEREVIFSRFHRVRAIAGKVAGLGLGLYISRGLVEAHGGRIWVESEEGRFTTFYFALPAAIPPEEQEEGGEEEGEGAS